jgi:very-short-patch-repair endonuclease
MKTDLILTYINNIPIQRNFVKNIPYNPELKERAKALRKKGNFSEVVFWKQVHKGFFWKIDFDRQRVIGNYIVDFYVKALGLIVEIDGSSHNDKEAYDTIREAYFSSLGLTIFKVTDLRVLNDLDNVMMELTTFIILKHSLTTPPFGHPSKGGEV